jgi:hypothetical protein
MFNNVVDAAAARSAVKARAKFGQVLRLARRNYFNIAVFSVAHPTAQVELAGFALHEPAKANPLHAASDQEMKNHGYEPSSVLQMSADAGKPFDVSCQLIFVQQIASV